MLSEQRHFLILLRGQDLTLCSVLIAKRNFLSLSFLTRWFTTAASYIFVILEIYQRYFTENLVSSGSAYSHCLMEGEYVKASALYDSLWKATLPIRKLYLIVDRHGGQNKNSIAIRMCCLRPMCAPNHIEVIELVFPIASYHLMVSSEILKRKWGVCNSL